MPGRDDQEQVQRGGLRDSVYERVESMYVRLGKEKGSPLSFPIIYLSCPKRKEK